MKIRNRLFVTLLFFLLLLTALPLLLQYYAEHRLIPKIAAQNGIPLLSLQVDRIGINRISISNIKLEPSDGEILSIDSAHLYFNPLNLHKREVQEISLSGLEFSVRKNKNSLSIAGIPTDTKKANETAQTEPPDIQTMFSQLPVKVEKVSILNSTCTINLATDTISIPYSIVLDSIDFNKSALTGDISLVWLGKRIGITGKADFSANNFSAKIHTERIPINLPSPFLPTQDSVFINALAHVNGEVTGTITPFSPVYSAYLEVENLLLQKDTLKFSSNDSEKESSPIKIEINGNQKNISTSFSHINMVQPFNAQIEKIHFNTEIQDLGFTAIGGATINILFPLKKSSPSGSTLKLAPKFQFSFIDERWEFSAETPKQQGAAEIEKLIFKIPSNQIEVITSLSSFFISGTGNRETGNILYRTKIQDFEVNASSSSSDVPEEKKKILAENITLEGNLNLIDLSNEPSATGTTNLSIPRLSFSSDAFEASSKVFFSGNMAYNPKENRNPLALNGLVQLDDGTGFLPEFKIKTSTMSAKIPIRWPMQKAHVDQGEFAIKTITHPEYELGEFTGKIKHTDSHYHITSFYSNDILEQFSAELEGTINFSNLSNPKAHFTFTIPQYTFQSNNRYLASLVPDAYFTGKIELQGTIDAALSGYTGGFTVNVSDTDFSQEKSKLNVTGISLKLPVPDINRLESGTSSLSFTNAEFGDMHLNGGTAFFQLESLQSILVEKSSLNWAGGQVDIMGTRIKKNGGKQQITLYCNDLNLADVLSQFGISSVSGNGKVNGKIPFIIENGLIQFDDAFLYSTPGTGGSLQLKNSDILLAGIPPNTQQYSQLDFAGEALKHFNYKSVTLNLKSEGESAELAMKLDGKPASPLPFRYNVSSGSFIRLAEGNKGIDYPIALDVNFHLPLNKFINYGKNIKDLF